MPTIDCPQCAKRIKVPDNAHGKTGRCAACQHQFAIQLPVADVPLDDGDGLTPLDEGALTPLDDYALAPVEVRTVMPTSPPAMSRQPGSALSASDESKALARASLAGLSSSGSSLPGLGYWLGYGGGGQFRGLIVAAVALVVIGVGAAIVLPGMLARKKGDRADVFIAPPENVVALEAIARQPKPADQFWIPAEPLGPAVGWKVAVEEVAPAPKLRSAIPLVAGSTQCVLLADPAAARAASLQYVLAEDGKNTGLQCALYDLRQAAPLNQFPIVAPYDGGGWIIIAALSPLGDLVALAYSSGRIDVWSAAGENVHSVQVPPGAITDRIRRLAFASQSRLLVDDTESILAFDLPTGDLAFQIPVPAGSGLPILSPGRKWLAFYTGDGFAWHSTTDGSPAGKIQFHEQWKLYEQTRDTKHIDFGIALHPSGRSVAVFGFNAKHDVLIAHYDLGTGRPLEQFVLPLIYDGPSYLLAATWCGDRQLFFLRGHVIDLDLRTCLGHVSVEGYGLKSFHTQSPDGRLWRIATLEEKMLPDLGQLDLPPESNRNMLVASTLLDDSFKRRKAAAGERLLWGPGFAVAVDADETFTAERRPKILAALADELVKHGIVVDPQARYRMMLKNAVRLSGPNPAKAGTVFYTGEMRVELVDEQGQTASHHGNYAAYGEGGYNAFWKAIAKELTKMERPKMSWHEPAAERQIELTTEKRPLTVDGLAGGAMP